jgi:hypothetical protein
MPGGQAYESRMSMMIIDIINYVNMMLYVMMQI